MKKLSLSTPYLKFSELKNVYNCIKTEWISTSGTYINLFEKKLSKYTKSNYTVLCNSGTSALDIALKLTGIKKNDEVIVPTLTFIATINCIIYNNASPIFMDSDETFNIDVKKVLEFIENRTFTRNGNTYNSKSKKLIRAIIIVHVWGNVAEFKKLIRICKNKNIKIIEDATESLGSKYYLDKKRIKHTGTIGDIGCTSFNGNKIITTGAGGAIFLKNKKLYKHAQYLISQAKDNFDKFIHNNVGYNYRMPNINAAIGLSQLNNLSVILDKKKFIHNFYLKNFKNNKNFEILDLKNNSINNNWLNILIIKNSNIDIKKIHNFLISKNIECRYVWFLNHLQKPFLKFEKYKINSSLNLLDTSLCLPSSTHLNSSELKYICKTINEYV